MSEQNRIAFEKWAKENGARDDTLLNDITDCTYIVFNSIEDLKQFVEAYTVKVLEDKERDIEGILDDTQSLANELLRSKSQITELQAKIEDKEREVAELKELVDKYDKRNVELQELAFRRDALQASNNDLRGALEEMVAMQELEGNSCEPQRKLLEATPAESLQSVINETIEKCAKVCDEDAKQSREFAEPFAARCAELLAEAIRALKGK